MSWNELLAANFTQNVHDGMGFPGRHCCLDMKSCVHVAICSVVILAAHDMS
jgi:hypothetical protein